MTCKHESSDVVDSRRRGLIGGGYTVYKTSGIKNFVVRRRKCCDCGAKFTTVEVEHGYMRRLMMCEKEMEKLKRFVSRDYAEGASYERI